MSRAGKASDAAEYTFPTRSMRRKDRRRLNKVMMDHPGVRAYIATLHLVASGRRENSLDDHRDFDDVMRAAGPRANVIDPLEEIYNQGNSDEEEDDHDYDECDSAGHCEKCCKAGRCTSKSSDARQGQYETERGYFFSCKICGTGKVEKCVKSRDFCTHRCPIGCKGHSN